MKKPVAANSAAFITWSLGESEKRYERERERTDDFHPPYIVSFSDD